jgi:hypothetical protein
VLSLLGISLDKTTQSTITDFSVWLLYNIPLGGLKSGSLVADSWVAFGNYFPLAIAAFVFLFLIFFDMLTLYGNGRLIFSPLLLLFTWKLFGTLGSYGFSAEGVASVGGFYFRVIPQSVIFYMITVLIMDFIFIRKRKEN